MLTTIQKDNNKKESLGKGVKMKNNHKIGKLIISAALAGTLVGVSTTVLPKQPGALQTIQAKSKKTIKISKYSENNNCILKFDVTTKTLHIKEGANNNILGTTPIYEAVHKAKKHISKRRTFKPSDIKHISIDNEIALSDDSKDLFSKLYNLEDISGLDKVDTGISYNLSSLFAKDKKLKSLDLSSWDTSTLQFSYEMFSGDKSLTEINLTGWGINSTSDSIFDGLDTTKVKIIGIEKNAD
ncbi:BspA family leucine-rich repeat surface protein [Lactobacillus xylocopicola]|uniref:Surface protein n=1 Tax=Lactobacillus xylocopicola TaxID=2976676 RepID=A0ABM8BG06_9LACO|nr:BspA family leucine-rich repeat surface protein [Lactobacillus xylocopicola]BDR60027.1 hypothetical protein KIM322_02880 [Lactobacillus xylocopicola]